MFVQMVVVEGLIVGSVLQMEVNVSVCHRESVGYCIECDGYVEDGKTASDSFAEERHI